MPSPRKKISALLAAALIAGAPFAPMRALAATDSDNAIAQENARRAQEAKEAAAAAQAKALRDKQFEANQTQSQVAVKTASERNAEMAGYLSAALSIAGVGTMIIAQFTSDVGTKATLTNTGNMLMMGGMATGLVGKALSMNANKAAANTAGLDSLGNLGNAGEFSSASGNDASGTPKIPTTKLETVKPPGFSPTGLDPELDKARAQLDKVLTNFEKTTGIPRSEIESALAAGKSPADFLDGRAGLTKDGVNAGLAKAQAGLGDTGLSSNRLKDLAASVGMGDIAAKLGDVESSDYAAGGGAGSGGSGGSSLPPLDFGGLMPPGETPPAGRELAGGAEFNFERDVNPEIKKQLIAQGVVQGSLFDMVRARYRAVAPGLLGYGPTENRN